jgi:hypothetical protein
MHGLFRLAAAVTTVPTGGANTTRPAAAEAQPFLTRAAKWLIGFDYDQIRGDDIVEWQLLGKVTGWWLFLAVVAAFAVVWFTFRLYRREGRAPTLTKMTLAFVRTLVIALVLVMLLEPALVVSRYRVTLSPVIVLADASESITLDDLYNDMKDAQSVATATGKPVGSIQNRRVARQTILNDVLNNPNLDMLNKLARKNPVEFYTFSVDRKRVTSIPLLPPKEERDPDDPDAAKPFKHGSIRVDVTGGQTRIGRAVSDVLEAAAGMPIAAVIVLSDGQDNDSDLDAMINAGKTAGREGVPIFAVPVGLSRSRKTKNIRVDKNLRCNRTLFAGDTAEFVALVSPSGYGSRRVKAILYRQKMGEEAMKKVAEEEVELQANATDQPVALTYKPEEGEEGEYIFTIRIPTDQPGLEDEHLLQDNESVASGVRVVKTQTNVLLIAGTPTWEYRRLKQLLIQDKTVTLSCWLQSAGREYPQLGNRLLRRLPRKADELLDPETGPHVIILCDLDGADFGREWFELLERFVDQHAGGLMFIAGETHTYDLFRRGPDVAALTRMLPIDPDLGRAQMEAHGEPKGVRAWPLRPTEDGLQSPLLKFSTERETTERIWQRLPGTVWSFPVRSSKPTATVLIRTTDPRRRITIGGKPVPMPVLVSSFYGRGRVAWLGSDETWRWRKLGIRVYDTFWTQAVRSLVEGRLMGGKKSMIIETDSESYALGELVTVTVRAYDASGEPLILPKVRVNAKLAAAVQGGAAPPELDLRPLDLRPVPGAPGTFKGQFAPPQTGFYKLSVGSGAGAGAVSIEVASQFEFDRPEANRVRLAEMAEASGGDEGSEGKATKRVYELGELPKLIERIESKKESTIEPSHTWRLWTNPLTMGLFVLLLGIEWAVRKRSNMA